jgi:O-antigen/teichoic acid export membrane protein
MSESMPELLEELGPTPPEPPRPPSSGFAHKIAAIFATRVAILGVTIVTSLVITRLLTPNDRGAYVAVVTLPGMLTALAMLGLPGAVNYSAGRGNSIASLIRASLLFTVVISVLVIVPVWICLPLLEESILRAAPDHLARVMLLIVPAGVITAFGGTILYGRQEVRVYNAILLLQAIGSLVGALVLVGIFRMGVTGAVATSVVVGLAMAAAVMAEVLRLGMRDRRGAGAPLRGLITYGLRLYPSSVSGYFNYRADNYIIQGVAPTVDVAKVNLGLYSWAVTMAEIVFLVPESVASMFLPRVAASSHEEAAAMLGRVARVTLLISIMVAILLIPAAFVGVSLILPRYVDSLPAFLAILPGVLALCMSKVATSYIGGRGRPGPASIGATIALAVNVPLNLALIPVFGIVGASLSSVVSYSVLAALMVWYAGRISGQPLRALCVPRREDLALLAGGLGTIVSGSLKAVRRLAGTAG